MPYAETWAQDLVTSWAMLCTRVQLMEQHYEDICYANGPRMALRMDDSLLRDLAITVMDSKGNKVLAKAFREIKACQKKHNYTLKQQENRLIPAYLTVRKHAVEVRFWGKQLTLDF